MSEQLKLDREAWNEILVLARKAAEQRFSPSPDRCPYCDTKAGDEAGGLHLLFDWEHVQPGDILWDGEMWMACRWCNWDFEKGKPYRTPENAIIMESYYYHLPTLFIEVQKGEKLP